MSVEKWRSRIFEKKIIWPKNGPFRARKGPNWGFRSFSCSKFIRFCRCCILVWYGMVWGTLSRDPLGDYISHYLKKNHLRYLLRCPHALPPSLMEREGRTCYGIAHRGIANTELTEPALWQLTAHAYDTAYNGCMISRKHCLYCIPFFIFSLLSFDIHC